MPITRPDKAAPPAAAKSRRAAGRGSVQRELMLDVAEPVRGAAAALFHIDRMQLALDVAAPEFEEALEFGIIGRQVEFLPDKALQQGGMVRQVIDDLRGRQPVPLKLQLVSGHVGLVRSLRRTGTTSMPAESLLINKKT